MGTSRWQRSIIFILYYYFSRRVCARHTRTNFNQTHFIYILHTIKTSAFKYSTLYTAIMYFYYVPTFKILIHNSHCAEIICCSSPIRFTLCNNDNIIKPQNCSGRGLRRVTRQSFGTNLRKCRITCINLWFIRSFAVLTPRSLIAIDRRLHFVKVTAAANIYAKSQNHTHYI